MNKKVLIVGPAWVGDMVMAQCLFKLLKQRDAHVTIDVLAPAWSLPLIARMPEVSSSIVMTLGHGQLDLRERYRLSQHLREKKYDQAIVLPNSFKSALTPYWARIPKRTGWRGEMRFFLLNDLRVLDKKRFPLMIERFIALGLDPKEPLPSHYPMPELQISGESQAVALKTHSLSFPKNKVLGLAPGAEFGPAKRWPEAHFATIANEKLNEGWQVWIFGSPKDNETAANIMTLTGNRCINLTGKTRLEEAVDLLSLTTAVVSNDSGLMHIAAALRKPLVAIYGPTSATFTPPLHTKAKILSLKLSCQPCLKRICPLAHQDCLQKLDPAMVLGAIDQLVN